jgi:hypothetical protein
MMSENTGKRGGGSNTSARLTLAALQEFSRARTPVAEGWLFNALVTPGDERGSNGATVIRRAKEVRQTLIGLLNEADRDPQKVRDRKLAALTLAVRKVCNAIDADREAVPDDDVAQLVAARDRAIMSKSIVRRSPRVPGAP